MDDFENTENHSDLSWSEMFITHPQSRAYLCNSLAHVVTEGQSLVHLLGPKGFDPLTAATNAPFLNALITFGIELLDVPIGEGPLLEYRDLCLAVMAQNPNITIRLHPNGETTRATALDLVRRWPGQVVLEDTPVATTEIIAPVPVVEATPQIAATYTSSSPAAAARPIKFPQRVAASIEMDEQQGTCSLAISRRWSLTHLSQTQQVTGPYAIQPVRDVNHAWVPLSPSFDVAPERSSDLIAVGWPHSEAAPVAISAVSCILWDQDDMVVAAQDDRLDHPIATGSFLMTKDWHCVGLIIGSVRRPMALGGRKTYRAVTADRIWNDLSVRADLGEQAAGQILSDLTKARAHAGPTQPV